MADDSTLVMDLVELQLIDNALSARQSEMDKLEDRSGLDEVLKRLEGTRKKYAETEGRYDDLDARRKKLEDTVGINEEKISSDEKKLFGGTVSDARELSSYQEEISRLKKTNSSLEDQILGLMEEQEELEPAMKELKKKIQELESSADSIKNEIEEKREVLKHNIDGLRRRREDVTSRIGQDDLKKYNDTKNKKGGIAVSIIKDGFCGVCNMEIPSIEIEKFVDSDTVYKCPLCGRLSVLYRAEMDDIRKEIE